MIMEIGAEVVMAVYRIVVMATVAHHVTLTRD